MALDGKTFGCGFAMGGVVATVACAAIGGLVYIAYLITVGNQPNRSAAYLGPAPASGDDEVTALLEPIRSRHDVPALAAALVTCDGLVASGVVGWRKKGAKEAATIDDHWHLGSDTKAMTATLVAKLVEQGRLRWDSTMGEVFPDLAGGFHPDMRKVNLLHLLSHRAGLPANLDLRRYSGNDVRAERLRAVEEYLAEAPESKPGRVFEYSSLGYVIVGAVIERVTNRSWEDAIRAEVFEPLGMTSAGFGGLGTPGHIDQPWGHNDYGAPVNGNGPKVDNPPVMGPGGRVHCSLADWAKFAADQLAGALGKPALLKPESYRTLHTPPFGGKYALGWNVAEREWGGGIVLNHGGSNTMHFANIWLAPKRDFALLACTNQGGDTAFKATDAAVTALMSLRD